MTTGAPSTSTVLRKWDVPPDGVRPADGTDAEMESLLRTLPPELSDHLRSHFAGRLSDLNEIYLQLGQRPECIFANPTTGATLREDLSHEPCSQAHVDLFASLFAADEENQMSTTKRRGIAGTLHRVSLITHPMRTPEKVLGVAVRVGRALQGLVRTMAWESFLTELAVEKKSLVLIGKPGVGKTTALREMARTLADDRSLNVVVVDKTCEIAGDGDAPHPAIGKARWMPVGKPNTQHAIMREAVENQTPDVIVVDEISTPQEVEAARTISQRGVMLIATVHGRTLPELINCRERCSLTGGSSTVTLSGHEAERRYDKRKQVQKRAREPVFAAALELHGRDAWVYHPNVRSVVDAYFEGEPCDAARLRPGRAVAVASIPGEGTFEYCEDCGGPGGTCSTHAFGHGGAGGDGVSGGMGGASSAGAGAGLASPSPVAEPRRTNASTYSSVSSGTTPVRSPVGAAHAQQQQPPPTRGPLVIAPSGSLTGFTYSGGGSSSGGASKNRGRNRRWRAPRGSGRCFSCNQDGHYARDCPN